MGSGAQRDSGSTRFLAVGSLLLQATLRFFRPFPQIREHCAGEGGQLPLGRLWMGPAHQAWTVGVFQEGPGESQAGPLTSVQGPVLQAGGQLRTWQACLREGTGGGHRPSGSRRVRCWAWRTHCTGRLWVPRPQVWLQELQFPRDQLRGIQGGAGQASVSRGHAAAYGHGSILTLSCSPAST